MSGLLALDGVLAILGDTGPAPPGADRVQLLLEWVGIAIFVALMISAAVILARHHRIR